MWADFKAFLLKQNIMALAIAFVVGAATTELVQALVADFIMPIVTVMMPGDQWRTSEWNVGPFEFLVGHFLWALINFLIIGFVAWRISKIFIRQPKPGETPATRSCPYCKQQVDATATRCSYCTSELVATAA